MSEQNNKTELLLFALKERYESQHKIRERVQSVGFWSLGLLLSSGVWFLKSDYIFDDLQKIIIIIGVLLGFYILRFMYLSDLSRGFRDQQKITVKIEDCLGYYSTIKEKGSNRPIYPLGWKKSGTEESGGKFFNSTHFLLYLGFSFLIISIIFNGVFC